MKFGVSKVGNPFSPQTSGFVSDCQNR